MNTKLLKQKILDLAIRGKLVPQDPNDEPASELLKRIRAEKEKLIAEGKIKRPKNTGDKPHYENVPFEIPESWEWCKVEDFAYDLLYGTSEKSLPAGIVPVLRMGNISRDGTIDYTDLVYSSNEEDIAKFSLQLNDLLFNRTNSSEWVGKTAIYKAEKHAIFAGYLIRIRTFIVSPDFINYVMNSSYHRHWCNQVKTDAVNQSNINAQKLSNLLVPIPPLKEQKRIASEIEQWMVLIDEIETDKQSMQEFIKLAKSKILGFAIHGKLVHHDPNDEPAVELLKRINPNATICDTSHYENLPKNWAVVNLLDLCKIDTGKWDANHAAINGKYRFYTCSTQYSYSDTKRFSGECIIIPGNGDIGNVFFYDGEFDAYQRTYVLSNIQIYPKYLYYHLLSNWRNINTDKQFGSTIKFVRIGNFQNYIVMLPPIEEQKRIVSKIDELFSFFDSILLEL